jgi:hypothetical protein
MINTKRLLLIATIMFVLVASFLVIQKVIRVRAQDDLITSLSETLTHEGVPLLNITTLSRSPFQIEISIERTQNIDEWSSDDLWYDHLSRREAELAYLNGHRLDSYTLAVYNPQGELLKWEQTFLSPGAISQNPYPYKNATPDDKTVEQNANDLIELYGLSLDSLQVKTGIGSRVDVQLLTIQMSANDLSIVNEAVPNIIPSIRIMTMKLNEVPGGRIAIIWLKIINNKGDPLLEYLWDLELDVERGGTEEGVTSWFTGPLSEPEGDMEPTNLPLATVSPTLTNQPYPEPINPKVYTTPQLPYP